MTTPQLAEPTPQQASKSRKAKNVPGLIAFIAGVVGFIFACIPGALIIGWVLLPVAFILGIVGLVLSGKAKGLAIAAVVISVVGTIVGVIVFFAVAANSFSEAFGGSDTSVSGPADNGASSSANADGKKAQAKVGTRDNPAALGSVISSKDWDVTVNSITLDGTATVLSANQFNSPPAEGNQYAIVNMTVTYKGDDSSYATMVGVAYVSSSNKVFDGTKSIAVAPEPALGMDELYKGGSVTGNQALEIPITGDGVLRVRPGIVADSVFVSIK